MFRPSVPLPFPGTRSPQPSLRRDENAVIGVERLADQPLGDLRPVGVRGVDEIDTQLWETFEGPGRLCQVNRRAPDAWSGDTHGAKAKAMDLDVAADFEGPRFAGVQLCAHCSPRAVRVARSPTRVLSSSLRSLRSTDCRDLVEGPQIGERGPGAETCSDGMESSPGLNHVT